MTVVGQTPLEIPLNEMDFVSFHIAHQMSVNMEGNGTLCYPGAREGAERLTTAKLVKKIYGSNEEKLRNQSRRSVSPCLSRFLT